MNDKKNVYEDFLAAGKGILGIDHQMQLTELQQDIEDVVQRWDLLCSNMESCLDRIVIEKVCIFVTNIHWIYFSDTGATVAVIVVITELPPFSLSFSSFLTLSLAMSSRMHMHIHIHMHACTYIYTYIYTHACGFNTVDIILKLVLRKLSHVLLGEWLNGRPKWSNRRAGVDHVVSDH